MNEYDIKRFGLILSIQAEIEAMKVANIIRSVDGFAPVFIAKDFYNKAEELKMIASKHNYNL